MDVKLRPSIRALPDVFYPAKSMTHANIHPASTIGLCGKKTISLYVSRGQGIKIHAPHINLHSKNPHSLHFSNHVIFYQLKNSAQYPFLYFLSFRICLYELFFRYNVQCFSPQIPIPAHKQAHNNELYYRDRASTEGFWTSSKICLTALFPLVNSYRHHCTRVLVLLIAR